MLFCNLGAFGHHLLLPLHSICSRRCHKLARRRTAFEEAFQELQAGSSSTSGHQRPDTLEPSRRKHHGKCGRCPGRPFRHTSYLRHFPSLFPRKRRYRLMELYPAHGSLCRTQYLFLQHCQRRAYRTAVVARSPVRHQCGQPLALHHPHLDDAVHSTVHLALTPAGGERKVRPQGTDLETPLRHCTLAFPASGAALYDSALCLRHQNCIPDGTSPRRCLLDGECIHAGICRHRHSSVPPTTSIRRAC